MPRRHDFHAVPCPKCGAAIGKPCISASGREHPWNDVHVIRLRMRHDRNGRPVDPASVQVRYDYPKRPKAVGVILVSALGVQVLAQLVPGR